MKSRLSSSFKKESGFTLVEVAVGLAVSMFLLVTTIQFLTHTIGVVTKLNIQRDIRDQGLMAVETIEREFRKVLEYGRENIEISSNSFKASFGARSVSIMQNGDSIALTSGGETMLLSGKGKCVEFEVFGLVGDEYISGSEPGATGARVIVIGFILEDDTHGEPISRSFKAAFSSAGF